MDSSSDDNKTRSRGPNFTPDEQLLLFKTIKPYLHIIESRKPDNVKQSIKKKAWADVTNAFNAQTKGCPRTSGNLHSCYRNAKTKIRKHSEANMHNNEPHPIEEYLSTSLEENGKEWIDVSASTNKPSVINQEGFTGLHRELKKDQHFMNVDIAVNPASSSDDEDPLSSIKKQPVPQMDSFHSMYGGHAELMAQHYQSLQAGGLSEKRNNQFGELPSQLVNMSEIPVNAKTSRPNMIRKKRAEMGHIENARKRSNMATKVFQTLTEKKKKLVDMQIQSIEVETNHKMELHQMALENIMMERKFKETLWKKQLELLELQIREKIDKK